MVLPFRTNADVSTSDLRSIQHLFHESYKKQGSKFGYFVNAVERLSNRNQPDCSETKPTQASPQSGKEAA
jgi:hypothetical protein